MEPDCILEWFRYAEMDLLSAERNARFHPVHMHLVCFLCQQSVEKSLKGFLIYHGIEEPPKTHELGWLCKLCLGYDERFNKIANICNELTAYGVEPRYPGEMEISENDMKKALMYAKQIAEFEPLQAARKSLEGSMD